MAPDSDGTYSATLRMRMVSDSTSWADSSARCSSSIIAHRASKIQKRIRSIQFDPSLSHSGPMAWSSELRLCIGRTLAGPAPVLVVIPHHGRRARGRDLADKLARDGFDGECSISPSYQIR